MATVTPRSAAGARHAGVTEARADNPAYQAFWLAGDAAAAFHPSLGRRIRVEHWANASNLGIVAARTMLGTASVYDRTPYFFSDQYEFGMEYSGHSAGWDEVVFRGDPASREFLCFWVTVTSSLRGLVRDDACTRAEFLALARVG